MEYKDPKREHFRAECTVDGTYEDNAPRFTLEAMANLPLLPDDVLLCIMKYLGPVELHNLSKITERLGHLASDKSLWRTIDFRPHKLTSTQLLKYVNYFKESTKFLAVRGFASEAPNLKRRDGVLTPKLLEEIVKKCPELETLILDEYYGPACKLSIELLPSTICRLSMRDCVITDLDPQNSYFHDMYAHVPYIKVLILSNCKWVSPHDFMAISKCHWLEELRMDGCLQLGDCVAYTSLAARCGFHSLKILDLRNTRMGDSDVACFSLSLRLTHLYLQCPSVDNEVSDDLHGDPNCVEGYDFLDCNDDDDTNAPSLIEDICGGFSPLG
ncbi:hypothetical protein B7P43_G08255, partial [Cryptotermes secundus]